jgi:hypothetical protein
MGGGGACIRLSAPSREIYSRELAQTLHFRSARGEAGWRRRPTFGVCDLPKGLFFRPLSAESHGTQTVPWLTLSLLMAP